MKAAGWWFLFRFPVIPEKKEIGLPSKTLIEGRRVAFNWKTILDHTPTLKKLSRNVFGAIACILKLPFG